MMRALHENSNIADMEFPLPVMNIHGAEKSLQKLDDDGMSVIRYHRLWALPAEYAEQGKVYETSYVWFFWPHTNPHPKRHLGRFIRFCRVTIVTSG